MDTQKKVLCILILAVSLLVAGCTDQRDTLTLKIETGGEYSLSEINLLHLVYIPIVEDPDDGLVVRTCPEDLEDSRVVGHSYYAPSEKEKERGLQFIVHLDQPVDPNDRPLLKENEIFVAPGADAVFLYLEAWYVDDISRRTPQISFSKRFQWVPESDKQMHFANSVVFRIPDEETTVIELSLQPLESGLEDVSTQSWLDGDRDLFGLYGHDRDCLDQDFLITLEDGSTSIEIPGCEYHPFAQPDGCKPGGFIRCDCLETTPLPTTTSTSTLLPTVTLTPTVTPTRPTPTITLTSTPINTPTPTPAYALAPLRRATKAAPAVCPAAGASADLELPEATMLVGDDYDQILAYLNKGGSADGVLDALTAIDMEQVLLEQDVTQDGVSEIILTFPFLDVLGCVDGKYERLLRISPEDPNLPVLRHTLADLNGNQVPDLVVETEVSGEKDYTLAVRVLEWDGVEFVDRLPEHLNHPLLEQGWLTWSPGNALMYEGKLKLVDVDINGTIELVLEGGAIDGLEDYLAAAPLTVKHIWMWTGSGFDLVDIQFSKPTIKVHAAQIGDAYSLMGNYKKAIEFYQQSIFDPELLAWNSYWFDYLEGDEVVEPGEIMFPWDYQQAERIEMYSRFRMLLVNHLLGDEYAVETQYESIRDIAEEGTAGAAYAELALVFEDALNKTVSISQACQVAVQFADKHTDEILSPLEQGVYGKVFPSYVAEDICPFTDDDRP
jgi:tetratricopeptide (TPR) repeat protein